MDRDHPEAGFKLHPVPQNVRFTCPMSEDVENCDRRIRTLLIATLESTW